MERGSEEGASPDEEDGDQAASWIMGTDRSEDEEVGVTESHMDILAQRLWRGLVYQDQKESKRRTGPAIAEEQAEVSELERDESSVAPSVSPFSLMDICGPSMSSLSSSSSCFNHHYTSFSSSSSSSSALSLTPPLPPSVELSAVLTDTRLTLDVYQGGAAALPLLWASVPEQLRGLQYLRLGSENKPGLDGALDVLPHLTKLRSLAIRGIFLIHLI